MKSDPQAGFSVLEILVASAVLSILLIGLVGVYSNNVATYKAGQSKIAVQQNGRVAMSRLARELRGAGFDLTDVISAQASPTPIQVADASVLTFLSDADGNDVVDRVTYSRSGTQLIRQVSAWNGTSFPAPTSSVMADNVVTLVFSYFDGAQPNNNPLTSPVASTDLDDIRRVTVSLVTANQVSGATQQSLPLVLDIKLRNAQ